MATTVSGSHHAKEKKDGRRQREKRRTERGREGWRRSDQKERNEELTDADCHLRACVYASAITMDV